jgi:hypothetical protein
LATFFSVVHALRQNGHCKSRKASTETFRDTVSSSNGTPTTLPWTKRQKERVVEET